MGCGIAEGTVEEFKFGSLDVRDGSERQRYSDERVLPDGFTIEFTTISWFRRMEEIIIIMCLGDYFVIYPFFNFFPVKEFK